MVFLEMLHKGGIERAVRIKIDFDSLKDVDLDELIPMYAENKAELDSYKKLCDTENSQIKDKMLEIGQDTYSAGGYKAKRTVSERVSMNEDKLLTVMKKHNINEVIKTREYVDMDALENYLYHIDEDSSESEELLSDIDKCREIKEVVQLRVSKEKKR